MCHLLSQQEAWPTALSFWSLLGSASPRKPPSQCLARFSQSGASNPHSHDGYFTSQCTSHLPPTPPHPPTSTSSIHMHKCTNARTNSCRHAHTNARTQERYPATVCGLNGQRKKKIIERYWEVRRFSASTCSCTCSCTVVGWLVMRSHSCLATEGFIVVFRLQTDGPADRQPQ